MTRWQAIKQLLDAYISPRISLLKLTFLCIICMPFIAFAMLVQVFLGSNQRVMDSILIYDKWSNLNLGGSKNTYISTQVGNALIRGKRWAKVAAWIIDGLLGEGHCLSKATIKQ